MRHSGLVRAVLLAIILLPVAAADEIDVRLLPTPEDATCEVTVDPNTGDEVERCEARDDLASADATVQGERVMSASVGERSTHEERRSRWAYGHPGGYTEVTDRTWRNESHWGARGDVAGERVAFEPGACASSGESHEAKTTNGEGEVLEGDWTARGECAFDVAGVRLCESSSASWSYAWGDSKGHYESSSARCERATLDPGVGYARVAYERDHQCQAYGSETYCAEERDGLAWTVGPPVGPWQGGFVPMSEVLP